MSDRVKRMQKQVQRGLINARQAVEAASDGTWTDSEIKLLKATLAYEEGTPIFEQGAEDSLHEAKRALDGAIKAYSPTEWLEDSFDVTLACVKGVQEALHNFISTAKPSTPSPESTVPSYLKAGLESMTPQQQHELWDWLETNPNAVYELMNLLPERK